LLRHRRGRPALATLAAFTLSLTALIAPPGAAAATVGSDQAQIAQLEKQIATQGARVKSLVTRYNAVQARIDALDERVAQLQKVLTADQRSEAAAQAAMRRVAIQAYLTHGGNNAPALALFDNGADNRTMLEVGRYASAVNGKFGDTLNTLQEAQARTEDTQRAIRVEQAHARATLRELTNARHDAQAAIASDEAMLERVHGDLAALIAAAQQRQRAAQLAAERALAARALAARQLPRTSTPSAGSAPSGTTPPASFASAPPPILPPVSSPSHTPARTSPNGYANPLRDISGLIPERVDQGVDYAGFGSIYAIGKGVVLTTSVPGWPGGTFIAYRLTDGAARGLVVYAAEDIAPSVRAGDTVTADTVLGQMYVGPDGVETGWGDSTAVGDTMARTYGQYDGGNSTAFGANFSELLASLGAPPGILQNNPPTGGLPAGWPRW
jgi:peptidoglycan hydrolase CwlO-like protein